ncbi:hypothetical protein AURDEDRAFT_172006 [Auricularia subglabra TFB-10046 SS5]|nr:hypothetical protein AURDEDRAFT_172006 [Auricularia subglabra TFB-10046 SS5]
MFPSCPLKHKSVSELTAVAHRAVEDAVDTFPGVIGDPTALLDEVLATVRRALESARWTPSRPTLGDDVRPILLDYRSRIRITAAVHNTITSELDEGVFQGSNVPEALLEAICAAVAEILADIVHSSFARKTLVRILWAGQCRRHEVIDVATGHHLPLRSELVGERDLYFPCIQFVRPSSGILHRAVAALPPAEPLFLRIYDNTRGCMHFAVGTATGRFLEFIGVNWDLWAYMGRSEDAMTVLGLRVYDFDCTSITVPKDETIEHCFPCAEVPEMRERNLDRCVPSAGGLTQPATLNACRLLWPRPAADSSNSGPGEGGTAGDVFTDD